MLYTPSNLQAITLEQWATKVVRISRTLSPTPPGYSCTSGMAGEARFFSIADDSRRAELIYYHPQRGPAYCSLMINGCVIPWERVVEIEALWNRLDRLFGPVLVLGQPAAPKVNMAIARFLSQD